jgi:hypothetical protein
MSLSNCFKMILLATVSLILGLNPLSAQEARLKISHLDKLAAKADQTVDVNLDASLLQLAAKFLSSSKPDEAKAKELIGGLKGVYVRSFEFDSDDAYSSEDVNAIRTQLQTPGWVRMVGVRSKHNKENVEVFTSTQGEKINGLTIISAEPRELTVINIVGTIDLEKLSQLEGQFGIPKMGLEPGEPPRKDKATKPKE